MNFLGILQILGALVPLVKSGVELAESTIGPGRGTEKLARATQAVNEALPKVAELAGQLEAARAAVGPMIEATVAAANAAKKPKRRRRK